MAKTRVDLQYLLEGLLGSRNVYFQPPANVRMNYPAIVYQLSSLQNVPANNDVYLQRVAYDITVIDEDPESEIASTISKLPLCRFDRFYTAENLNHFVYTLYY